MKWLITLQFVVTYPTLKLPETRHANVRYASEALAEFTLDATALRRGDSRSQLRSADYDAFEMPRACPVESHADGGQRLTGHSENNVSLHGASPWHPDHSAADD